MTDDKLAAARAHVEQIEDPMRCLLTVDQAAALAGVPLTTLRHWVQDGRLKAVARRGRQHLYVGRDVLLVERAARLASVVPK